MLLKRKESPSGIKSPPWKRRETFGNNAGTWKRFSFIAIYNYPIVIFIGWWCFKRIPLPRMSDLHAKWLAVFVVVVVIIAVVITVVASFIYLSLAIERDGEGRKGAHDKEPYFSARCAISHRHSSREPTIDTPRTSCRRRRRWMALRSRGSQVRPALSFGTPPSLSASSSIRIIHPILALDF